MKPILVCSALAATVIIASAGSLQAPLRLTVTRHTDIGVLRGNSMHLFGRISDVAADARGNVYVLDDRFNDLRAFDSTGRFLARTGRSGQRAGEFSTPSAITVLPTGRVAVIDEGNQRLSLYQLLPDSLELVTSLRVPRGGSAVCALGSDFVVHSFVDGKVLRRFTTQGRLVETFGRSLTRSTLKVAQHSEASGPIVCVPDSNIVIYTSRSSPTVAAVHADGRVAWETTLRNFTEPTLAPAGGRTRASIPAAGHFHRVRSAFLVAPKIVAVQLARMGPSPSASGEQLVGVETRYLALDTGVELGAQDDLPLLSTVMGSRAYGARPDSFPIARVYRADFAPK
jgi:hypothetical protein